MEKDLMIPTFDEDEFDLQSYKKAADAHVQNILKDRRTRRKVKLIKIAMFAAALIIFLAIYYSTKNYIDHMQHNRYSQIETQ